MKIQIRSLAIRMLAVTVTATMLAGTAPAMASAIRERDADPIRSKFANSLAPMPAPVVKLGRVLAEETTGVGDQASIGVDMVSATQVVAQEPVATVDDADGEAALEEALPRTYAVVAAPVSVPEKPRTTDADSPTVRTTPASSGDELAQAKAILAGLTARYPILAGTAVSFGSTPGGYQAVAYYQSGRIVVNPNHTASLSTILNHEVWHIIDWRDNGQIDWGENVPPR